MHTITTKIIRLLYFFQDMCQFWTEKFVIILNIVMNYLSKQPLYSIFTKLYEMVLIVRTKCVYVHITWNSFFQKFASLNLKLYCVSCHSFSDVGCDLGHFSSKQQIRDSILARLCFTKEFEAKWILSLSFCLTNA